MEIRQSTVGTVTVLEPVGKLVLSEGASDSLLKDTVSGLMNDGRTQFLVSLAHVAQVDTSGLTNLVSSQIMVLKRGGRIRLSSPTKRIRELLAITRLNTFFEVFDTEREAIESFTRDSGA